MDLGSKPAWVNSGQLLPSLVLSLNLRHGNRVASRRAAVQMKGNDLCTALHVVNSTEQELGSCSICPLVPSVLPAEPPSSGKGGPKAGMSPSSQHDTCMADFDSSVTPLYLFLRAPRHHIVSSVNISLRIPTRSRLYKNAPERCCLKPESRHRGFLMPSKSTLSDFQRSREISGIFKKLVSLNQDSSMFPTLFLAD